MLALLRVLRLHQWSKNVLVFVPLAAAHKIADVPALTRIGGAFLAFGLVASSVYVLNDLLDIESDRKHPRKRHRPFASGELRRRVGVALSPALLAGGGGLALFLPPAFAATLGGYWVATLAYSALLKRVAILDVFVLAGLYTIRIYAGAFAADVPVSEWLASFSLFFFLSLATLKRATELGKTGVPLVGRGYQGADHIPVTVTGIASGYVSVLVLALYVNHPEVTRLYTHPAWLWGLCILALYWLSRVWLFAWRGVIHDDPVVFALRDPLSWVIAALGALVVRLGT